MTVFDTRSYAGQVYVLDARSGTRLRRVAVGPNPTAVAVAAGRVLVVQSRFGTGTVSGDGFLSILDARSGRVLRTVDVPDPWGTAVNSDEDNAVSVPDLRGGAVVRTLPGP